MPLSRYTKAVTERKRYQIDYTNWLDAGELVASVTFIVLSNTVSSPVVVDGIAVLPSGLGVQFYVSGGVDGVTYQVNSTMLTNAGQTRLDSILYSIKEP